MVAQIQRNPSSLRQQAPRLAQHFEQASLEELLHWVDKEFGEQFILACAFGPESLILIDMLSRIQPKVRAFFLDTEFHFPETLALKDQMLARYPNLELTVIRPLLTVADQEVVYGPELYQSNPDRCCALRKVEPLERALRGYDCWLSGLRREQSATRAQAPVITWDWQREMLMINPLVKWTKSQVWHYILDHGLPYNRLHDEGYPSIGCAPCTNPVQGGSDERSGRWQGTGKRECGIHV